MCGDRGAGGGGGGFPLPLPTACLQEVIEEDGSASVETEILHCRKRTCAAKHEGDEIRE